MVERPLLTVNGLNGFRDNVAVTFGINLSVNAGEIVGILGPNGSGKSTIVDGICGLAGTGGGVITLDGEDVTGLEPYQLARRGLIQVSQGRDLFPLLSVGENVLLGRTAAKRRGINQTMLDTVLDIFPVLRQRWDQRAASLSGGEQQMVAVARGLMGQPKVMLLDEPTTGLAPVVVDELTKLLRNLLVEGVTLILVEQHVDLALAVCQRFIVIRSGRCFFDGSVAEMGPDAQGFLARAYV